MRQWSCESVLMMYLSNRCHEMQYWYHMPFACVCPLLDPHDVHIHGRMLTLWLVNVIGGNTCSYLNEEWYIFVRALPPSPRPIVAVAYDPSVTWPHTETTHLLRRHQGCCTTWISGPFWGFRGGDCSVLFRVLTPCSLIGGYQRFGGTCLFHL
jgi:hypothetical protein